MKNRTSFLKNTGTTGTVVCPLNKWLVMEYSIPVAVYELAGAAECPVKNRTNSIGNQECHCFLPQRSPEYSYYPEIVAWLSLMDPVFNPKLLGF